MDEVPIPTVFERGAGRERVLDIYSRLLDERIVFLGSPIDDAVANVVIAQLLHLESADATKEIRLYINSPGGSSTALLGIYDTMRSIEAPVSTWCIGMAASAAAVLLAAGAPGRRHALAHSTILIHQPHGQIQGQALDIEIHAKEIIKQRRMIDQILAEHTGRPAEQITRDTDRDFVLSAEEAREYGLIDRVVGPRALRPVQTQV